MRESRAILLALALLAFPAAVESQPLPRLEPARPLTVLDVPYIAQSELLCGGAAAAMVMRYWGERGVDAEAFGTLVDARAGGIRTAALAGGIRARGWNAVEATGTADTLSRELRQGRPVIVLLEEGHDTFHYVVVVARGADGVVYHDPARAPFRVASSADFDRRWSLAGRWMLIVTPGARGTTGSPDARAPADTNALAAASGAAGTDDVTACDRLVADGVRQAQANDLVSAERTLASATSCPGAAAFRELAGIRAVQRRWPEAADLAGAAVRRDPSDAYAWKLLATARFVTGDSLGAIDAWNRDGEPRIDLIRLDGLTRTRYAVVQRLIGLRTGDMLTRQNLIRARRRLGEMPTAFGTLDFQPVPSGLAEVRGAIAEQPLFPHGALDLGLLSLVTVTTRELAASVSSPTGGGERFSFDWRFWPKRPLYRVSLAAPAPWGGVWVVTGSRERQPFTAIFEPSVHDSAELDVADWLNESARWQVGAGADRWNASPTYVTTSAGVRLLTPGDRLDTRFRTRAWFAGGSAFESAQASIVARSSARPIGIVFVASGGVSGVTARAPGDLWFAGDTGRARPLLLRAHPVLGEGARLRTDRLGRLVTNGSAELQRWWRVGPFRVAAATFADTARTALRADAPGVSDVDVGAGVRGALAGRSGALRLDVARGLRDGATAFSIVYSP